MEVEAQVKGSGRLGCRRRWMEWGGMEGVEEEEQRADSGEDVRRARRTLEGGEVGG